MNFSTALNLYDVDDYIAPSKTCVKPVKIDKKLGTTKSIRVESDGTYIGVSENGATQTLQKAGISLNDCLACSGCITTSETILISTHSLETFLNFVRENRDKATTILVVSLSPQSLSSIASHLHSQHGDPELIQWFESRSSAAGDSMGRTYEFLTNVFRQLGAHFVLHTTFARNITLLESASEFCDRYHAKQLPVFCSVCPGWVCYAEKTPLDAKHPEKSSVLPYLSTVRSPQQITGRLVKATSPQDIYHVSVMPCFDKKLEASRSEFSSESEQQETRIPDVDLVLATNELLELLKTVNPISHVHSSSAILRNDPPELNAHLQDHVTRLKDLFRQHQTLSLYRHAGSGSGGYTDFVFRYAAQKLFGISLTNDLTSDAHVVVRQLFNKDVHEWLLFASSQDREECVRQLALHNNSRTPYRASRQQPSPLLAFAEANGFRNIQNMIQPLKMAIKIRNSGDKRHNSQQYPYDYVEIMACPGGCLSGGGQLRGMTAEQIRAVYFSLPPISPWSADCTKGLYEYIDQVDPEHASLRTSYRLVPRMEVINPSALQW